MSTERVLAYARAHRRRFVAELKSFVRIPSVSALPRHAGDVARCAGWLAAHLRRIGLDHVAVISTPGHPIVYGEWRYAPVDPTIRGENLFGRGACDDKGQMLTHVKAVDAYLQTARSLPVNVKC